MQVLRNQQFSDDFPVKFHISECIVSDDADNNSCSFTEEQTVARQTVTCKLGFCLQADIEDGAYGYDDYEGC